MVLLNPSSGPKFTFFIFYFSNEFNILKFFPRVSYIITTYLEHVKCLSKLLQTTIKKLFPENGFSAQN